MLYRFGECELDTHLFSLRRGGVSVPLRPKVFQVLTYLLRHRDRVVSKQELCEQIWSARVISDSAIENTVKAIRRISPIYVRISRGQASSGLQRLMINVDHFERYRAGERLRHAMPCRPM
jgi:hypothetical protein